jgi:hypothetical protein
MLTIRPDPPDSRAVFLEHAAIPGALRLLMWEKIYFLNWAHNGWRAASGQPGAFVPTRESGGFRREMRSVDGVSVELALVPKNESLLVTISAKNITQEIQDPFWGAFDIHDLWLDLCVHYRDVESLYDPDFARTFLSVNGKPSPLAQTDLTGHRKAIAGYWMKGESKRFKALPELHNTYGTGISATETDGTWLAVESRDRRFTLLTQYTRVSHLWANRREPMHGCIHANPLLGDLPVGGEARMTGLILLAECNLAGAIERAGAILREHNFQNGTI